MKPRKNNRTPVSSKGTQTPRPGLPEEQASPVLRPQAGSEAAPLVRFRLRDVLPGLLLMAATVVVYLPALRGNFIWDDDAWTTNLSRLFRGASGLWAIWCDATALQQYYPLSGTTFWLDYQLWKFWPLPYHLENILLHALSVVLFWRLLRRLEIPGAWLAAGIFAVHPVMVESTAWITERKNVLSLPFYLGALLAYGRYAGWMNPGGAGSARRGETNVAGHPRLCYALALFLFLGALLAKTTAFSLPAVLLLIVWWKHGRIRWRADVVPALPFFALALGLCAVTAWLERTHVGAEGPDFTLSFPQRCLIAGRAFWFYPGKLLRPAGLCFVYPRWTPEPGVWWQWLVPLSALGAVWVVWAGRGRLGRGPVTALLYYVGTLFPVMGFLNAYGMRYAFVWDHWVYVSSLGLIALAAALVVWVGGRLRRPAVVFGFAAVVLPVLAVLTWRQCGMYADLETLWRTTLARNPACWLAYNNMAFSRLQDGQVDEAVALCQKSLSFNPRFPEALNNLGYALMQKGRVDDALECFRQAVATGPGIAEAHYSYACALRREGRGDEAITQFQEAILRKPYYVEALDNLGSSLLAKGDVDGAIAQCGAALAIDPDFADAHNNLANALLRKGRVAEAAAEARRALATDPGFAEAHYNLGNALLQLGQVDAAIAECEASLAINPVFPEARYNLANALLQKGRTREAITNYQAVIEANPGFADAEVNLGSALLQERRVDEAITHLQKALALNPDSADGHNDLGNALIQKGEAEEGIGHLQRALQIRPDFAAARIDLDRIAWMLATSPVPEGRNGAKAVEIAGQTDRVSAGKDPVMAATLAAAYAEAGRFPDAVTTARRALQLASSQNNTVLAASVQAQLKLYQAGLPFHETAASQ